MDEIEGFAKLEVEPKSGDEPLHHNGRVLDTRLIDFWRWSASDLVSNATRGIFAEYIVAALLVFPKVFEQNGMLMICSFRQAVNGQVFGLRLNPQLIFNLGFTKSCPTSFSVSDQRGVGTQQQTIWRTI